MNIVIHGTKGGWCCFNQGNESGLLDVTSDSPKGSAIGQHAYAIRFTAGNIIYSKYKIIRDVRGDKRTGFVGFSLFLQRNKKLSGTEIIALLDEVSKEYCQRYIVEDNLNDVRETWDFLETIKMKYEAKLLNGPPDKLQSNLKDDAFAYFKDLDELYCCFDQPFQEEYSDYRQVLFVSEDLRGKEKNPLNALRHGNPPSADLTGKIDWTKRRFKLREFDGTGENGISIEIRANGKVRTNGDIITNRDDISITYSKPYYIDDTKPEFKLDDANIKGYFYIDKDRNEIKLVRKGKTLKPKTKIISFEIKDQNGSPVTDAQIKIGNNQISNRNWKNVNGYPYECTFEGEEMKGKWNISAIWGDFNGEKEFLPDETNETVTLELVENRIIKIKVKDSREDDAIWGFKVSIKGKKLNNDNELTFVGTEIDKKWTIEIKHPDYHSWKRHFFVPREESEIIAILNKQEPIKFKRGGGNHGRGKEYSKETSKDSLKRKRTIFSRPAILVGLIVFVLIAAFSTWFFWPEPENLTDNYGEGIASVSDSLEKNENDSIIQNPEKAGSVEPTKAESNHIPPAPSSSPKAKPSALSIKTDEIVQFLKGNELVKFKLEEYKKSKDTPKELKKSIQLALDFWELDGITPNKSYHSFLKKIKDDGYFKESKLKDFVTKMTKTKKPKYLKDLRGGELIKTLAEFESKSKTL